LASTSSEDRWNVYALPAAISLGFLVLETGYLALRLPETRSWKPQQPSGGSQSHYTQAISSKGTVSDRLARLKALGFLHGLFLLSFSGVRP